MNWKAVLLSPAALYIGLVSGMLSVTLISAHLVASRARETADAWERFLQPKLQLMDQKSTTHFCVIPNTKPSPASARLEQDYWEVRSRMDHHLAVLEYFYINYFRAIVIGASLGAVAGVCLFYIVNKGWSNANNYIIVAWVFSTVTAAYYFSYVTIFRQQENIADNKALYLQYVGLGNEILTYCATGTSDYPIAASSAQPPQLTVELYAHQIDARMAAINNIAIGFDYTKITDYKQLLSDRGPAAQTAAAATKPQPH